PDACLGFGSVLSLVRDRDLIPHDDDLDIIVGFPPEVAPRLSVALTLAAEHLTTLGYKVSGKFFSHRHVSRGGMKLDVFVGIYEDGDSIGWFPGARGALRRCDVFPA